MADEMECSGIVLAGGRSSRFGSDKAVAMLEGTRLIEHVARALGEVCGEVIAVARPGQDTRNWPNMRIVTDDPSLPEGPLRGIYAGLCAATAPWAFVVSCDAPRIEPELLRTLYRAKGPDVEAAVPRWDGYLQPLVALYAKTCVDAFRKLLEAGERSPKRALASVRHTVVDEAACRTADPSGLSFINVNRVEDLERSTSRQPQEVRGA